MVPAPVILHVERVGERVRICHPGLYDQLLRRRVAMARAERILERAAVIAPPHRDVMLTNVSAIAEACR